MTHRFLRVRLAALLCVALLLAACGMKGPLYLEPETDEDEQAEVAE